MSVARTGLPHTDRTPAAEDRSGDRDPTATAVARPQLPAPDHPASRRQRQRPASATAAPGSASWSPSERATGTRLHAREVAAAAGISERRAYELLRAVRAEDQQP